VCIQTVIDTHGDARLVVKIGDIKTGALSSRTPSEQQSLFSGDFFRCRVRWTELQLILNEVQEEQSAHWSVSKAVATALTPRSPDRESVSSRSSSTGTSGGSGSKPLIHRERTSQDIGIQQQPVATLIFSRFTFDYQRVFKDSAIQSSTNVMMSPERSQISLMVHNVQIKDLTPDSPFPMVFDSTSNVSFLDLCVRVRGTLDADLVQVDLFDLNLAHTNGKSETMILTTSEDYVWRILDLTNRIIAASGDFAGVVLKLEEDKEHGGFIVKIEDSRQSLQKDEIKYTPPKSDTLYDVTLARVSPFSLLVSFRRNPHSTRYKKMQNTRGATLMNYFTQRLKFTIDRAELNFARYEDRTLKGPPDRLVEKLVAVYFSRMKFKLVTLLSAASLQDWKFLAARDTGDDEYVEGDILRATGNLAGKSANLVFKRVGQGLGTGVSGFSRAVGNTIENSTERIGAGRVGAGVNSVVTGVGDGVGDTLTGGMHLPILKILWRQFLT
jgi:vacuolar protein sorting-associated protein 13A/C